jgi:hypothetical protein
MRTVVGGRLPSPPRRGDRVNVSGDLAVPSVRGGDVRMAAGGGDALGGRQIAGALYGGIGK